jgi:drug/metabolite transporter (DMT)-like permease
MNSAGYILGKFLGIGIAACILTAIPMVVGSLIGKPLSRPQLIATFVVAVLICIGAMLIGANSTH